MRGLFVTFEGIDRSGKTTQAQLLADALGDQALGVREPGGTPAGERVRDLLKDAAVPLGGQAEALLFAAARGLGVEEVERVNAFATGGLRPDLTFLLAIDPTAAASRAGESDRFEDEGLALQEKVLAAYEDLAAADPGRWRRIDGGRPPDAVHADVLAEVEAARAGARA